jgi:hypothetical protein
MPLEGQAKDIGQAVIAGSVPVASYLNDFSLWVTILAGIASFIWAVVSLVKLFFPKKFNAFVKRIDE